MPVSSVLDFIDDAIISTNDKGIITIFNKSAENYIPAESELCYRKKILKKYTATTSISRQ